MNKKAWFILGVILIVFFAIVSIFWLGEKPKNETIILPEFNQKACTQEAKICPDGSAVGRTGDNCEFSPCPDDKLVGNDKDEHGCIGSAGYVWCEAKQKCLRVWEEKCEK
ncbi:MAG: hypothetical protein CO140_03550 [Candidatus Moranbacteria bacterium CG_4_9_14_3_um_filter_40_7]|nr:MAG: hypothetical protein COX31_02075 [Candidatus Moranbacteria bacterium CG23_combo_of_CG06-09_8_20_14_all_40_16]PIU80501.1 MAG: hypothetical protein COS71_03110 [Candidatus Moranbacteria bacterium CG06_land_8_20_14_3_00_40_12]PJA87587.1 MAG: hypothetical protein CO140_03550 [Candidatus Moranbacteria bacterium CG_4_9_14_3_um_filter_40_7]